MYLDQTGPQIGDFISPLAYGVVMNLESFWGEFDEGGITLETVFSRTVKTCLKSSWFGILISIKSRTDLAKKSAPKCGDCGLPKKRDLCIPR